MHVCFRGLRETLEKVFEKFDGKIADFLGFDFCKDNTVWTAAQIYRGCGQRFIHRHQKISGPENSFFGTERFSHGLAERDADVLYGVVLVHVEIAICRDLEVESAMARGEIEHVVKEPDTRGNLRFSATVKRQP